MVSGLIRGRKRDPERSLHGVRNKNPIRDTRMYEDKFLFGEEAEGAYLTAPCSEKVWLKARTEFGPNAGLDSRLEQLMTTRSWTSNCMKSSTQMGAHSITTKHYERGTVKLDSFADTQVTRQKLA
jgi:hypothetical protein